MIHENDTPVSYYIDPVLYTGRPADESGRLPKEIRTYDFLDSLGISYKRLDHDAMPTIEACHDVDKLLGIEICKNLFLRNAQKTAFYLLLLPGTKKFKTALLS
ncbi:MAG: prolyl-tRNA synthetase associated domain-containing protein, partial [Lachnospiraceae bacterium]|nr:prolyl-tRNA synthetase associated domain-containing protein [Lachnospiraceae bacterium]